jgi:hypothetical protein
VEEPFAPGAVEAHVLGGPSLPEQLATGREFADQGDERLVVRVAARLQAQHRGRVADDLVVVDEELPGRLRLEVDEPGGVHRTPRVREHGGVEGPGEPVHGQHVVAAVADPGRSVGDRVEDLSQRRSDGRRGAPPAASAPRARLPGEGEEVFAFGLVQLQRRGQGLEHALGGAGQAAALHAHVVVHRDPGEHRHLLAAQPLDPAVAPVRRKARLLRGDARPPRTQEFADLTAQVHRCHAPTVGAPPAAWEVLPLPGTGAGRGRTRPGTRRSDRRIRCVGGTAGTRITRYSSAGHP